MSNEAHTITEKLQAKVKAEGTIWDKTNQFSLNSRVLNQSNQQHPPCLHNKDNCEKKQLLHNFRLHSKPSSLLSFHLFQSYLTCMFGSMMQLHIPQHEMVGFKQVMQLSRNETSYFVLFLIYNVAYAWFVESAVCNTTLLEKNTGHGIISTLHMAWN